MKKKSTICYLPGRRLRKILFGLVLNLLILSAQFSTVKASDFSQQTRIDVSFQNEKLEDVLNYLKNKVNYEFVYRTGLLKESKVENLEMKDVTLSEILNELLPPLGFSYEIVDRVVIVKSANNVPQTVTIRGNVKDSKKVPLPGVTILINIDGTQLGAATDKNGDFAISIPKKEKITLIFSFVGMKTKEVIWQGEEQLDVILEEDIQAMSEVVVTGYGNIAKGNYTGAATTVKGEDIIMAGVASVDQMLQGVVPGMLVWNTTGQVGASSKIRVRGTSTLLGNQEPVWVVDGVIQRDPRSFNSNDNTEFSVDADDIKQLAGNAISWLNPNDIETITVLKDASATAIYGSSAANGVIVITTKKANIGKISVTYSGDFTIGQRPRYGLYDLMNSGEHMQFQKEIYEERRRYNSVDYVIPLGFIGILSQLHEKEITLEQFNQAYEKMARQNTDWFDLLFRNSFNHAHTIGISGGSEKIQNRTSFGFNQQKGEAKGNDLTTFTVTSNTTAKLWDRITMNMLFKGTIRNVDGFAYGVDPFNYAYKTTRAIPAYNADGSLAYHDKYVNVFNSLNSSQTLMNYNILNELANTGSENRNQSWGTTFDLKWEILPGLEYQGLVAYNSSSATTKQFAKEKSFYVSQYRSYEYGAYSSSDPEYERSRLPMGGILNTSSKNIESITVRNSLVYDRLFKDKHRMTLQVGIETNSIKTKGEGQQRWGYMPDRGETFVALPAQYYDVITDNYSNNDLLRGSYSVINQIQNELSEFATAVYTYDNRYVVNLSGRLDASNRFGQDRNKRFEPTWSAGFKWRATNEPFLQGKWWLNNLDIYASYGYQGNAVSSVSPDLTARESYSYMYNAYQLEISSLPYPDLGWEKTKTYNLGLDASLLNGRLNLTFNYFQKISDVLSSKEIPYENGVRNGIITGTEMKNYGYDFVINVIPVRSGDFTWQLSLNTSVTRNKVKNNNRINTLTDYENGSNIVEGRPFSTFYSYEFAGLDPEHGQPTFKNLDLENGFDPRDYMIESGKFTPDFSGGLNMMFKYKNLSLYALFAIQWGGHNRLPELYPISGSMTGLPLPDENVSKKLMERWKKPGDENHTNIPALPLTNYNNRQLALPETMMVTSTKKDAYYLYNKSDVRVANTDFIRCRSISLTYEFGSKLLKQMHIQRLQLKASMTNPFMWVRDSKWDGLDPETGNWPARRTSSLSLQVMF